MSRKTPREIVVFDGKVVAEYYGEGDERNKIPDDMKTGATIEGFTEFTFNGKTYKVEYKREKINRGHTTKYTLTRLKK